MEAKTQKIEVLMSSTNTTFSIPVYQRDYNWEERQCKTLFKDILNIGKDISKFSHFIGSIVYIKDNVYVTDDKKDLEIIDGQQRITTLTLLYIALYHVLKSKEEYKIKAEQIYEQYLINKYSEKTIKLKLLPPKENLIIVDMILREDFKNLTDYEESNFYKNYMFFKNEFDKVDKEEIKNMVECIINGFNKLIFIEISLEKGKDEPQKIFESLNSTGLALSQADLIRNYILMGLERNIQNEVYRNYWLSIENNCKVKNIQNKNIETYTSDFIRDYLTFKTGEIPSKNRVFEIFKKYYIRENKELEELKNIKNVSYIYSLILNPSLEKNKELKEELKNLQLLGYSVINPFLIGLIKLFKEDQIKENEMLEILNLIQSYLWRRYITGIPTNSLNSIFQNLYLRIFERKNLENSHIAELEKILLEKDFPTDEELKEELKIKNIYKEKERLKYIFKKIENYNHKELIDFDNENITIEHIFPQKPTNDWERDLGNQIEHMITFKDTISNLTLTGSNPNLSNKTFKEKRDFSNHGYKDSKLYVNKYLADLEKWDITEMEKRFEILFSDILKIWKRPEVKNKTSENLIFFLSGNITSGSGRLLEDGKKFELFKDSELMLEEKIAIGILNENLKVLEKLKEKKLIEKLENKYILKENYICNSPSGALKLVLGYSGNGWSSWKTYDGKILDELRKEK